MSRINYSYILKNSYPTADWTSINEFSYDTLKWYLDVDTPIEKPTKEHLDSLWEDGLKAQYELEEVTKARKKAYQEESDPLFFAYQRGELTEQEWLDKVQEIKQRYPNPV